MKLISMARQLTRQAIRDGYTVYVIVEQDTPSSRQRAKRTLHPNFFHNSAESLFFTIYKGSTPRLDFVNLIRHKGRYVV
jgi:hypothetical protein